MPDRRGAGRPWERRKGESAPAFAAFSAYLEMGPERSIRAVAQKCTKSVSLIRRWSSAYHWVERVRAWDNQLQEEARRASVAELREMTRRHILLARQMQGAAVGALKKYGPDMVNPKNFAAIVKLGTELERCNREAEAASFGTGPEEDEGKNNLLEAVLGMGEIDTSDLPEVE